LISLAFLRIIRHTRERNKQDAKNMELNDFESANGVCDHCAEPIDACECEIHCGVCEDAMPRRHKHVQDKDNCATCGQPYQGDPAEHECDFPANQFD
jgi:hypothetical protein